MTHRKLGKHVHKLIIQILSAELTFTNLYFIFRSRKLFKTLFSTQLCIYSSRKVFGNYIRIEFLYTYNQNT